MKRVASCDDLLDTLRAVVSSFYWHSDTDKYPRRIAKRSNDTWERKDEVGYRVLVTGTEINGEGWGGGPAPAPAGRPFGGHLWIRIPCGGQQYGLSGHYSVSQALGAGETVFGPQ